MSAPGARRPWPRLAAVALLSGVVAFAGTLVVLPFVDDVATTRAQLERETRALWQLKASLAQLEAREAALSSEESAGLGWAGRQLGQVTAVVQARLSEVARTRGIRLRSVTSIPSEPIAETETVGLRLEAEAPLDQIAGYLRDVETLTPVILVRRLNLRRLSRPTDAAAQPVVYLRLELAAPIVLAAEGVPG